jgi:ATPase subunit of ABC transporter with duplicated ATPase domains
MDYIFTMREVTKVHPPDKKVLDKITLAFLPGAKIGVIGGNGSGKSSLLKVMAGIDKDIYGEAKPHPNIRVGYFAQEPELGDAKTVKEAVDQGVANVKDLITEFET